MVPPDFPLHSLTSLLCAYHAGPTSIDTGGRRLIRASICFHAPLPGHNPAIHRRCRAEPARDAAGRPVLRRIPLQAAAVRGPVLAELAVGDGHRPPAGRPHRPGRPRRAEAAADVEAARRAGHRIEPDHQGRLGRHRRAQAVDRGRPVEHHRLRRRDLRRRPREGQPPPVAPGRAVPALPARHAPGVHRRRRRARRLRLPALRDARPQVAAVRPGVRGAPGDEPVLHGRPGRRLRELSRHAESPAPTTGRSSTESRTTAFRPHKRLLDHVAKVIRNEPAFTLLDEQLVAYNAILDSVRNAGQNKQNVAFIIAGGPGTGKSVIAVNLVAELSALGVRRSTSPARRRSPRTCARSSAAAPARCSSTSATPATVD